MSFPRRYDRSPNTILNYKELVQSGEVDRNRLVIQHNNDQSEVLQLTGRANELEACVRENNTKVEGPDDGHFIVRRAHAEIQTAQNEARIAHEELTTEGVSSIGRLNKSPPNTLSLSTRARRLLTL